MRGTILILSLLAAANAFPAFIDSDAFMGLASINFDASGFISQLTDQLQKQLEEANVDSEEAVPYTDEPEPSIWPASEAPEIVPYTDEPEPSIWPASEVPEIVPYTDAPEIVVPYKGEEDMSKSEHTSVTDEPEAVPYKTDEPEAVPYKTDEPEAVPYKTDEPEAVPYKTDEPEAVPYKTDAPEAVPYTDEPEAVPYKTDEPEAVPY